MNEEISSVGDCPYHKEPCTCSFGDVGHVMGKEMNKLQTFTVTKEELNEKIADRLNLKHFAFPDIVTLKGKLVEEGCSCRANPSLTQIYYCKLHDPKPQEEELYDGRHSGDAGKPQPKVMSIDGADIKAIQISLRK